MMKLHTCLLAFSLALFFTNSYGMDIGPSKIPLIEAVKKHKERKVQKLLTKNVDVNAQDERGNTALFWAAKRGNLALCKMLLAHGAQVELANKRKQTPLHAAAMSGNIDVVTLLIDRGANVNARDSYRGRTPLHWVVRMTEGSVKKEGEQMSVESATELIKLLLDRGVNPRIQDLKDRTALAWAKEYRLEPIVGVLTEASRVPSPPLKQAPQLQMKKEKKKRASGAKKAAQLSQTTAVSPASQTVSSNLSPESQALYSKMRPKLSKKGQKTILKKALRAQDSGMPLTEQYEKAIRRALAAQTGSSSPVVPMATSRLRASQEIIAPEPSVPVVVEPIVPQESPVPIATIKEEAPKAAAVSAKTEIQAPAITPAIKPVSPEQVRPEYESSEDYDDYDDAPESSYPNYKFYFNTFPGTD